MPKKIQVSENTPQTYEAMPYVGHMSGPGPGKPKAVDGAVGPNPYARGSEEFVKWEQQFGTIKPVLPFTAGNQAKSVGIETAMDIDQPYTPPGVGKLPPVAPGGVPGGVDGSQADSGAGGGTVAQQGSQTAFQMGVGQMMERAKTNKGLQEQLFKMIRARYDRDLSTEDIQSLPYNVQQAIRNRDNSQLDFSIQQLRQQQSGQATDMSNALGYLVQGYKADVEQAQSAKEKAMTTFSTWLKDYGSGLKDAGISQEEISGFLETGELTPQLATKMMSAQTLAEEKTDKPMTLQDAVKYAAAAADPEAAWKFLAPLVGMTGEDFQAAQTAAATDVGPGVVGGFDITTYATDPQHEVKVQSIMDSMGQMGSVEEMDEYIQGVAPGSPVTGKMIAKASQEYEIPWEIMMAMMQQDSSFGTAGKAVRTMNPGNVGNDDEGNIIQHDTWQSGVDAVADWLSRKRVAGAGDLVGPAALSKARTAADPQELADVVMDYPELYNQLTSKEKATVAPLLENMGFTAFGKPLAESAVKAIDEINRGIDAATELKARMTESEDLGVSGIMGPISGLASVFPWAKERKKLQADIDRTRQMIGKALEGGVLRKEDEEKYKKILPKMTDMYDVAQYKIDQLLKMLTGDVERYKKTQMEAGRESEQITTSGGGETPPGTGGDDPEDLRQFIN